MKMIIFIVPAVFLFIYCNTDKFSQWSKNDLGPICNKLQSNHETALIKYYLNKISNLQKWAYT